MLKKITVMLILLLTGNTLLAFAEYDVKKFGAAGDGETDDSLAIQKAIDAALVNGGAVYFPAGRYRLKSTLNIAGNSASADNINWLVLRGEGGGSKLLGDGVEHILAGTAPPDSKTVWMNGARIESLTFTSFDKNNRCNAIDMSCMLRFYIDSCNFIRLKSCLVSVREFSSEEAKNKHSIWIVRISNSFFGLNQDWAINIRRAFDVVIFNNIIEHGNGGIQIGFEKDKADAACNTLRIENNVIEGLSASGKAAIRTRCIVGGRIVGNYFEANHGGDIEIIPGEGGWARGLTIGTNTFQPTPKQRATGTYGPILLQKAIDTTISNNFTTGARLLDNRCKQLGRNILVYGNTINNPASLGLPEGATPEERRKYEQNQALNELNRNRFVLAGHKNWHGIDSENGIVFTGNLISYADEPPKESKSAGNIVFNRKPEIKDNRLLLGWYCVKAGKEAQWAPLLVETAIEK